MKKMPLVGCQTVTPKSQICLVYKISGLVPADPGCLRRCQQLLNPPPRRRCCHGAPPLSRHTTLPRPHLHTPHYLAGTYMTHSTSTSHSTWRRRPPRILAPNTNVICSAGLLRHLVSTSCHSNSMSHLPCCSPV